MQEGIAYQERKDISEICKNQKYVIFRNKINFYTKIQTHFLFLAILAAKAAVYSED